MPAFIDLLFPVLGSSVATDHHYPLYAAVSQALPWLHDAGTKFGLAVLTGDYVGRGQLRLTAARSRLRLRLPATDIRRALPLAGKMLRVLKQHIRLGVPHVEALRPAPALLAHTVTIKHALEPDAFLQAARKQLDALDIKGRIEVPVVASGRFQGQPQRHILRVKDYAVIGYPLLVRDLTGEESLRLQEVGLGGRRRMGGGFFLPVREEDQ